MEESYWPLIWQALAGGVGGGLLGSIFKTKGRKTPILGWLMGAVGGVASGQGFEAADLAAQLKPILDSASAMLVSALSDPHIGGTVTALLGGGVLHSVATRFIGKKDAA